MVVSIISGPVATEPEAWRHGRGREAGTYILTFCGGCRCIHHQLAIQLMPQRYYSVRVRVAGQERSPCNRTLDMVRT